MKHHALGSPADGAGVAADPEAQARRLSAEFDQFNARMALLQREVQKWQRQAQFVKDRATQTRLVAQSRQFQEQYAQLGIEHTRLQALNAALQARVAEEANGAVAG